MNIKKSIRTRRGAKLNLKGSADKIISNKISSSTYALNPDDFFGLVPKLSVNEGDMVKAGDPVFFNKKEPRIKVVSPVSGTIKSINRGAKRKIEQIIIESDGNNEMRSHKVDQWETLERKELISLLLESGSWPFIKQRPYGTIANPDDFPNAIFVSTINTAPLGADFQYILEKKQDNFKTGLTVLNSLVDQAVFLGIDATFSKPFEDIKNVQKYNVSGPHPAGNLSLHIQELSPINMGDKVWTVNAEDVANIGSFVKTGVQELKRTIALVGSAIKYPKYFSVNIGIELSQMLSEATITEDQVRCINGNVLSGSTSHENGYLGYYNNTVSVIPEGNGYRMFGWLPFKDNHILSLSNTSFSKLFNKKGFSVNTNLNGEERALVVTGEMEKVFPLDLFPMQLIKACMIEDIEKMEALGIYEVVPEDFGLIDYANTSKLEAQEIIKQGIELMINEVG
jgi:Na+-transporting NADH:ubiquinone oxidoreductase subunit A